MRRLALVLHHWGCCSFALVLSQCPGSASLAEYGGTLFFPCRVVGLERTRLAFHSAAQLSERIGPRCLWSISPFLSFSSSSLPSHSPKLTTHTFASLLVQTTLARPPRLPLVSTCCFCDFFGPSATSDSPVLTDRRRRPVTLRRCAALYPHWNITSFVPDALRLKRGIPRN